MKDRKGAWELLRECTEFDHVTEHVAPEAIQTFKAGMGDFILGDCHGFWLEPETQDGHCDPAQFILTLGARINALCHAYNGESTQSPIEDMLLGALLWLDMEWCGFPEVALFGDPDEIIRHFGPRDQIDFYIRPQGRIGAYRADFLLWMSYGKTVAGIAVECDGHAFHEKTKEQASRDKRRDREILKAGFPVVRFSGSDVYKSPTDCVRQIAELLDDARDRVSKAAGLYA